MKTLLETARDNVDAAKQVGTTWAQRYAEDVQLLLDDNVKLANTAKENRQESARLRKAQAVYLEVFKNCVDRLNVSPEDMVKMRDAIARSDGDARLGIPGAENETG